MTTIYVMVDIGIEMAKKPVEARRISLETFYQLRFFSGFLRDSIAYSSVRFMKKVSFFLSYLWKVPTTVDAHGNAWTVEV